MSLGVTALSPSFYSFGRSVDFEDFFQTAVHASFAMASGKWLIAIPLASSFIVLAKDLLSTRSVDATWDRFKNHYFSKIIPFAGTYLNFTEGFRLFSSSDSMDKRMEGYKNICFGFLALIYDGITVSRLFQRGNRMITRHFSKCRKQGGEITRLRRENELLREKLTSSQAQTSRLESQIAGFEQQAAQSRLKIVNLQEELQQQRRSASLLQGSCQDGIVSLVREREGSDRIIGRLIQARVDSTAYSLALDRSLARHRREVSSLYDSVGSLRRENRFLWDQVTSDAQSIRNLIQREGAARAELALVKENLPVFQRESQAAALQFARLMKGMPTVDSTTVLYISPRQVPPEVASWMKI